MSKSFTTPWMIVPIIAFLPVSLAIGGCMDELDRREERTRQIQRIQEPNNDLLVIAKQEYVASLYRDRETGCEYFITGDGITPRYERNGRPICR